MITIDQEPLIDNVVGIFKDCIGLEWEAAYYASTPTLSSPDGLSYKLLPKIFLDRTAVLFQDIFGMYPNTLIYQSDDDLQTRALILKMAAVLGGLEVQSEVELHPNGWPQICFVYFSDPRGGDWDENSGSISLARAA